MPENKVQIILSADGTGPIKVSKEVGDAYKTLATRSVADINESKAGIVAAYDAIRKSGIASAQEIQQAEGAKNKQIAKLNEELLGNHVSITSQIKAHWVALSAGVTAVWAATSTARELMAMGREALLVESAFDSMAKSAGIAGASLIRSMQEATQHTVEGTDLMKGALKGLALGMTDDMIKGISEASVKASIIAGTTVSDAYEAIINAVSTGQYRALIRMGALTKQESMWLNQALAGGAQPEQLQELATKLVVINEKLRDLGDISQQPAIQFQKWKAELKEAGEFLGKIGISVSAIVLDALKLPFQAGYTTFVRPFAMLLSGPQGAAQPGAKPPEAPKSPEQMRLEQQKAELEKEARQLASVALGKEVDSWKTSIGNLNPYLSEASKKLAELTQKANELRKGGTGGKGELTDEQRATVESTVEQGKRFVSMIENAKIANAAMTAIMEKTTARLGIERQEVDLRLKLRAVGGEDTAAAEIANKYLYERKEIETQIAAIANTKVFQKEDLITQAAKLAVLNMQKDALQGQETIEQQIAKRQQDIKNTQLSSKLEQEHLSRQAQYAKEYEDLYNQVAGAHMTAEEAALSTIDNNENKLLGKMYELYNENVISYSEQEKMRTWITENAERQRTDITVKNATARAEVTGRERLATIDLAEKEMTMSKAEANSARLQTNKDLLKTYTEQLGVLVPGDQAWLTLMEKIAGKQKEINDAMILSKQLSNDFAAGMTWGLREWLGDTKSQFQIASETVKSFATNARDSLQEFFFDPTKWNFQNLATSVRQTFAKMLADMVMQEAKTHLFGGGSSGLGFIGSLFGMGSGTQAVPGISGGLPSDASYVPGIFHSGGMPYEAKDFRITFTPPASLRRAHTGLGPDEQNVVIDRREGIFTPGQMKAMGMMANRSGGPQINFHDGAIRIDATDVDSFRAQAWQIKEEFADMLQSVAMDNHPATRSRR